MLERDQVPPELAALYDALLQQRGVIPNMFKTVANTPALALGFAGLSSTAILQEAVEWILRVSSVWQGAAATGSHL